MRRLKSLMIHSQLLRHSLVPDMPLRQVHLYSAVSNGKCLYTSERPKSFPTSANCANAKLIKYRQWGFSLKNAKGFSTTITAMAKDKLQKEKKRNASKKIDEEQMALLISVEQLKKHLDRAIEELKRDYVKFISLRSSAGTVEQIPIFYKDQTYVLQEIAQINRKPNLVVINVDAFPDAISSIMENLKKSHMNFNPQQDGTTIYLKIPKVTKDHRENLVKNAKALMVKCKNNIKDVRSKYVKQISNMEKQPKDLVHRVLEGLDGTIDKYNKEAENIYNAKQQELLGE